jgi:hypothetical protein
MNSVESSQIAADIQSILTRDDLDEISATGRALIETKYSFDAAVERYEQILRSVAKIQ